MCTNNRQKTMSWDTIYFSAFIYMSSTHRQKEVWNACVTMQRCIYIYILETQLEEKVSSRSVHTYIEQTINPLQSICV